MTIRRPSPMALALTAAIAVIAGLAAALIAVTTSRHDGDARKTAATTRASSTATPAAVTVSGAVRMQRYDDPHSQFKTANWRKLGSLNCEGVGGYDDMTEGATVTVYDSTGKVIGAGALMEGLAGDDLCVWSFTVDNVPDAPFYQVEVSHRGKVTVARSEASSVSLSLG